MPDGVIRPDPDPTTRTVDLVSREIAALEKLLATRLDALEAAQAAFQDSITRVPTEVQKAISSIQEVVDKEFQLHCEKFNSVRLVLEERKTARAQEVQSNEKAIDRAFAASKEAYAENKSGLEKRIESITLAIETANKTTDGRINDLKDRLTSIETAARTLAASREDSRASANTALNASSLILAAFTLLIGLGVSYLTRPPPSEVLVQASQSRAAEAPSR